MRTSSVFILIRSDIPIENIIATTTNKAVLPLYGIDSLGKKELVINAKPTCIVVLITIFIF
ncbi:hypothetical protein CE91St14_08720 [Porphyromonas somerae]|nr:hypothetical protein CE91St14_08720 [Porphyromonas somerae]